MISTSTLQFIGFVRKVHKKQAFCYSSYDDYSFLCGIHLVLLVASKLFDSPYDIFRIDCDRYWERKGNLLDTYYILGSVSTYMVFFKARIFGLFICIISF